MLELINKLNTRLGFAISLMKRGETEIGATQTGTI